MGTQVKFRRNCAGGGQDVREEENPDEIGVWRWALKDRRQGWKFTMCQAVL